MVTPVRAGGVRRIDPEKLRPRADAFSSQLPSFANGGLAPQSN